MKAIVFVLVVIVLLAVLICIIAFTKWVNYDRAIKKAQLKEAAYWENVAKTTKEFKKLKTHLFINADDEL